MITNLADVGFRSFYNPFASKEELLTVDVDIRIAAVLGAIMAALRRTTSLSPSCGSSASTQRDRKP